MSREEPRPSTNPQIDLSSDRRAARIQINRDMNASEIDALIRQLSIARSNLAPPVPGTLEAFEAAGGAVVIEESPVLLMRTLSGGRGFRLWLRHRGLAWLGFHLEPRNADAICRYILDSRNQVDPDPDLFGDGLGNTH